MDTLFFIASKLFGALIRPDTWIVILAGLSFLALLRGARRLAVITAGCLFAALVVLAVLPLGQVMLSRIEAQVPRPAALDSLDGIVVLGGGENVTASRFWGVVSLGEGSDRLTTAVELAQRFPGAEVVFAGGSGRLRDAFGTDVSEADIAYRFLTGQGLAADRILIDTSSRNTAENAVRAKALAHPAPGETWVLVTSAFHMPRALRSFKAAGWSDIVPYPVDYRTGAFRDGVGWNLTRNLAHLQIALKEMLGSLAYRLSGK